MFTINEFDWIFSRIRIIMKNTNLNMKSAISRISDNDYEDFVRATKSDKTIDEFYNLLGEI